MGFCSGEERQVFNFEHSLSNENLLQRSSVGVSV
jgi:hypothetical protein